MILHILPSLILSGVIYTLSFTLVTSVTFRVGGPVFKAVGQNGPNNFWPTKTPSDLWL